jgi:hypothetical protein
MLPSTTYNENLFSCLLRKYIICFNGVENKCILTTNIHNKERLKYYLKNIQRVPFSIIARITVAISSHPKID